MEGDGGIDEGCYKKRTSKSFTFPIQLPKGPNTPTPALLSSLHTPTPSPQPSTPSLPPGHSTETDQPNRASRAGPFISHKNSNSHSPPWDLKIQCSQAADDIAHTHSRSPMKRQDRFKALDFVTDTGGKNKIFINERN